MTGYARREAETGDSYLMVELKSFNNRYLDINVVTQHALSPLEPKIRELVSSRVKRGKIECTVRYRPLAPTAGVLFDPHAVKALIASLRELQRISGVEEEVHLSHILRFEEHLRSEQTIDLESAWEVIGDGVADAIDELEIERLREGEHTLSSLREQLSVLRSALELFVAQAEVLETTIRRDVRQRFDEIIGNRVEEDRLLAEIASLLVRFSIEEEIVRFRGHLEAFDAALDLTVPVGKKLDFLCQELNREVNTIASKSPLYEINSRVVEAKDAIENMREQLRNVE
jgi:uncharacterized protein (TIGR00255 family)